MGCNLSGNPHLSQKESSRLDLRNDSLILVGCDEESIAKGVTILETIFQNCLIVNSFTVPEMMNIHQLSIEADSSAPSTLTIASNINTCAFTQECLRPLFKPSTKLLDDTGEPRTNSDIQPDFPNDSQRKKNSDRSLITNTPAPYIKKVGSANVDPAVIPTISAPTLPTPSCANICDFIEEPNFSLMQMDPSTACPETIYGDSKSSRTNSQEQARRFDKKSAKNRSQLEQKNRLCQRPLSRVHKNPTSPVNTKGKTIQQRKRK